MAVIDSGECPVDISDNIVNVFETGGDTDQTG